MPQMNYGKMMELEGDSQRVFIQQMEDEAAKYKAYQPFSTISHINLVYNGQFEKGYLYSEQLLATQRVNLAEGNWFAQYDANADYFDVILSGQRYADKQLGEVFEVSRFLAGIPNSGARSWSPESAQHVAKLFDERFQYNCE